MCRMVSTASVVGYTILLLAWIASALSFVAPFWVKVPDLGLVKRNFASLSFSAYVFDKISTFGLLAFCTKDKCYWVSESDFKVEESLQDWFKASQGLFLVGVVLLLVALILASCYICCGCCRDTSSINSVFGTITVVGAISIAVAIGVYAGFMSKDCDIGFKSDDGAHFFWAFYVAIAGAGLALISSIFFFCGAGGYFGYQRAAIA